MLALIFLVSVGVLCVISSILYFFKADVVVRLNEFGKKTLFSDEWTLSYRITMGLIFLFVGIFLFVIAFVKSLPPQ